MKYYIIYFLNGGWQIDQFSNNFNGNEEEEFVKRRIDYDLVDYCVPLARYPDRDSLRFKRYTPDGTEIWNKDSLVDFKTKSFEKGRTKIFSKLDLEFLISLENPGSKQTALIKKNKEFLRDLSIRDEMDSIHDCGQLYKLNAFYNLIDVEILDPGTGCSESNPTVNIDDPIEDDYNFGLASVGECVINPDGSLQSIRISKIGCGYTKTPNIIINGFNGENSRHPILKPIIVNTRKYYT